MCRVCDDPDYDPDTEAEDDIDGLRDVLRDHTWAVKCVEHCRRPYAYTLGLHQLGLPELLATGVTTDRALALFSYFAPEVIDNGAPAPGDRIVWREPEFGEIGTFEAVRVEQPDVHMGLGVALFGAGLTAVQLVWTDDYDRWPWDPAFHHDGLAQPVLGVRGG